MRDDQRVVLAATHLLHELLLLVQLDLDGLRVIDIDGTVGAIDLTRLTE